MTAQASGFAGKAHRCRFDTGLERYCGQGDAAVNATLVLPPVAAGKSAPRAGRLCLGGGPEAGQLVGVWIRRCKNGAPGAGGGGGAPRRVVGMPSPRFPSPGSKAKLCSDQAPNAFPARSAVAPATPRGGPVVCRLDWRGGATVRWRSSPWRGAGEHQAPTPRGVSG